MILGWLGWSANERREPSVVTRAQVSRANAGCQHDSPTAEEGLWVLSVARARGRTLVGSPEELRSGAYSGPLSETRAPILAEAARASAVPERADTSNAKR
jgi:hypothetical protein